MITTASSDSYYTQIDLFDTCELHAGHPLRFVCLECEECCICDECSIFIHASHRQQELKDYNRTQLKKLEDNRRRLTDVTTESKRKVDYLTKQIERSRRKSELAVEQATATVEYLWQEITRKKVELVQNINRYTTACANQLGQQQQELRHRLTQYKLIIERIENVAKSDNPSQIFKNVGGLKKHCSGALNLRPLCSLPVYKPVFMRNPNLLSDFGDIQFGVVVNSNDHSDNESEESDYVVEEDPWVYEVEPMLIDSVNNSDESDDVKSTHQDNASAGSNYCQQSGSEVSDEIVAYTDLSHVMPDCADNSSAGSSYVDFSETNIECIHHNPESFSEIKAGCSNNSSTGSGDASTFVSDLDKNHCHEVNINQQQRMTGRTEKSNDKNKDMRPKEEQLHTQESTSDIPPGHYSFARRKCDNSKSDRQIPPGVSIPMDDEHSETDLYESLLQKNDTSTSMLRSTNKYDSLLGSTLSLDRIEDRTKLPQKFQLHFNKSKIIQTENTILSGKVLKRVFLPFTFTGFTTVSRENDTLLAFVTTDKEVVLLRKNGVEFSRITELTSPFDVGSNGSFPYSIYITDSGVRPGEGSVRVYSCAGGYLDTFAGGLNAPRGIDLSAEGQVFVCDQADKCVYGFSSKGRKTLRLNIGGQGFPKYVSFLSNGRLAVSDYERENLIIYDIAGHSVQLVRTKVDDLLCRGMCSEDVGNNVLFVVHPEGNVLHVIRGGQLKVIDLGGGEGAHPLVPMRDERGNVFVF
ncbi:uncharacterized protein LOC110456484 [Mizuhopecten yessoensis]|uniref:B box-type domain-containing protein n=1 Tax=Mizuhopecten yessoensis TaxID=6573 RepID=A0A210QB29_MIZYE|nr:uncharacterized protein LOC110456484 [Mizuhopecten yessoensis]OWF45924.1 hypothetical protein KP79_PYT07319 [Mizuhopecten yessoensis]